MGGWAGILLLAMVIATGSGFPLAAARAPHPGHGPSILVISAGEDNTPAALRSRERARRTLITGLRRHGIRTSGGAVPRARRHDARLANLHDWVRSAKAAPVDVVVTLATILARQSGAYTTHLTLGLRVQLATVSDERTSSVMHAERRRRLASPCGRRCASRTASEMAHQTAKTLVPRIVRRISGLGLTPVRIVVFKGFDGRALEQARRYLKAFPGYRSMHSPILRDGETLIRYHADLHPRSLRRALRKMLRHLDMPARVLARGRIITIARDLAAADPGNRGRQW